MGSIINTFDKGLHQDSSFILQPDGTYRNMKNGMLISYDGNHYTVEMTKGNKVLLTLTPRYFVDVPDLDVEPMPIGFISFIDKLVVFSTNSSSTTGYGEIGVISFTRSGMDFVGTYVPYYHHASLNFTRLHKIEGFSFRENDENQRVYWTDNFNEPRVFDIANPIFTDYKVAATANELEDGKQYMVLIGAVTYNAVVYGPGLTAGNIISATTAGGTTFTVTDGTPLVIEYYPLALLDWSPSRLLGNIEFQEYGTGDKYCGSHIYFYRLSSSYDGAVTSWSYASTPIHVGMDNTTAYLTTVDYTDFVGNGSATTLENSGKSVKLNVTDIDTDFDTIEIACAEFTQAADVPYRIIITNKEAVTGSTMTIEDTGAVNLGTVTISDLTLFPASILKCKTINTNKNYSTIANITERQEFDLDLSGVVLSQFEYPMISHGGFATCTGGNVPADQSPTLGVSPGVGDIKPWSRYVVSLAPDAANRVEYPVASGTYYYTNDVFVGVVGSTTATFTGTAQARPCTTKNQYTKINSSLFSGNRVENFIELKTGFWDYKDPAVASHNKGYWSNEKYRFGILFYDLKGNPFYVKYIQGDPTTYDYTFDSIPTKGGLMRKDTYSGDDIYSLNPSAINVSGLDIPESVMNQISGFSIVRAERDPIVITQGLLMQSVYDAASLANPSVEPLGVTRTDYSVWPMYEVGDGYYVYSVLSPDLLTGYSFPSAVEVGANLKEACWISGSQFKADGTIERIFTKMFDMPVGATGTGYDASTPRTLPLQSMNGNAINSLNENSTLADFLGTGIDYVNRWSPLYEVVVSANVDNTCGGGAFGNIGANIFSVGCKKSIIKSQFNHFDVLTDYNAPANVTIYDKMLANFITDTDPSNLYGGISESAIANTLYMSCGHFQPINSQVKADTLNGTFASGIYAGENKYTFNDIEVFGGDCFTNLIDLGYGLWDETFVALTNAMSYALWFPCECNVNYNLRRGQKVSNKNMYPSGASTTTIAWQEPSISPTTQLESYSYNKGYTTDGNFIKYPSLPLNYKFSGNFDYRIRWSQYKTPGEINDSFRVFRIPDYRDVDGQRGQINNLKARDSKLFYWQDHSVGYTPILERQLVGGSALGDATALGVTGVIDRYDDIDTFFGNQHQHGLTETEYGFAWFDMRRRAFMVMGIGTKPEEMSMVKGLQVFFNSEFNEGNITTGYKIYNTNDLTEAEVPLLGYGIVGVYDPTFKMTYLTFKYESRDNNAGAISEISKDFTLGYNHILNAFVSFTDCTPGIWHNHNDLVVSANCPRSTKPYNASMPSTSYVIGDVIHVGNREFICIKDLIIPAYPPADPTKNPEYVGSIYWVLVNETNQIYLQNFGADLCKFYGKVFDFEQEVVVNFKTDMAVTPQNMQVKTIGPNSTSVYFDTENQASSDLNISTTNKNYRFIDGAWFFSVALDLLRGRLTDYYVRVKFVHKNYVTNPTTAKNVQKVTQWLKTMFVNKR